jgi:hypothetical protein
VEGKTLIKLAALVLVAIVIWKKGIPWWKEHQSGSPAASAASSPGEACASAASAASETWGSGIGRFANPPYDLAGWDDFRSRVEQQARRAEEKCLCRESSCTTAKNAMRDLRSLISELDTSLRSGAPPPSDLVQRQEAIDQTINSARDLAQQGK